MTLSVAIESLESSIGLGGGAPQDGCAGKSCRVLDVGCGGGQFLRALLERRPGLDAVGIDPYGTARSRGGVRFQRLGAEQVGDMLERFDLVVTSMSLHHFSDAAAFFRAARDAVRWQVGRLLVVDWKRGVDTGIPEEYVEASWVVSALESAGWSVLDTRDDRWHFAVLARPEAFRFAVALDEEGRVAKGMLGTAPQFGLFDLSEAGIEQVELRPNPFEKTRQHLKTLDVAKFLSDASLLVASRIGPRGKDRLRARGIRMLLTGRPVSLSTVWDVVLRSPFPDRGLLGPETDSSRERSGFEFL